MAVALGVVLIVEDHHAGDAGAGAGGEPALALLLVPGLGQHVFDADGPVVLADDVVSLGRDRAPGLHVAFADVHLLPWAKVLDLLAQA